MSPNDSVQEALQGLNDLELAIVVSLVAEEHCIFSSDSSSTAILRDELGAICTHTFGLRPAVIQCNARTTIDDFNDAILVDNESSVDYLAGNDSTSRPALTIDFSHVRREPSPTGQRSPGNVLDDRRIADVVIASDLDLADQSVQTQVLELIRARRIFTRTSMHTAPKDFLLVAVASRREARLSHHLNDIFAMSHFHASEDGLQYTDGELPKDFTPSLTIIDIKGLRLDAERAYMTSEVAAYLHNIVLFMRMSRYVNRGVTATATKQLRTLAKALAPLHGLSFVPPSLVVLAAKKVYAHRLVLATAETERSLQWGSDPDAVRKLLEGVTVEDVIDDVLASVETPL